MIYVYFIIGIVMFTCTTVMMAVKDKERWKAARRDPNFYVATVICMIFWPVMIVWTIYDLIRFFTSDKRDDSV